MRGARSIVPLAAALLAACSPGGPASGPTLDRDKVEAGVDRFMGGGQTCVVLLDTATGRELYQYGDAIVCRRGLPPCATFEIPNDLIGLDLGLITPETKVKWDGTPQPVKAWEADADLAQAYRNSIGWWQQRLAASVGHDRYVDQLRALDYGERDPKGPLRSFWMGSSVGGSLWISTRQQADFLQRLYAGRLPAKPAALAALRQLMVDEIRTDAKGGRSVISGKAGSCPSLSDGSRRASWWVGRLQTPDRDLVFAASMEAAQAPPGTELEQRMKDIFADSGLWPASA